MSVWLVCGGRDFNNRRFAFAYLDQLALHRGWPRKVIHGNARGADLIGRDWALNAGVHVEAYAADWGKHGRAAGPVRNQVMLDQGKPDVVVAFGGGRGTDDMKRRADSHGVPVLAPALWPPAENC